MAQAVPGELRATFCSKNANEMRRTKYRIVFFANEYWLKILKNVCQSYRTFQRERSFVYLFFLKISILNNTLNLHKNKKLFHTNLALSRNNDSKKHLALLFVQKLLNASSAYEP